MALECELLAAVSGVSSGHLRRGSDADTTKKGFSRTNDASILSWPTIMGHLRRGSAAATTIKEKGFSLTKDATLLSWPTLMGHQKQLVAIFTV
eukprot:scaffold22764_cov189-Skeletonema_dohrnii-CCMP3373.AAC.2